MGQSPCRGCLTRKVTLDSKLKALIRREGPITYETFLDTVLYDAELGYYKTGKQPRKDYLTSPEIHPVFAQTLGDYIRGIKTAYRQESITILELGGGSGILAEQLLASLDYNSAYRYIILEKGHSGETGFVSWVSDPAQIPDIRGLAIIIANEFFDALPFHRVLMTEVGLKEIYIDFMDGYVEYPGPLSLEVEAFLQSYPVALRVRQAAEVTPRSLNIVSQISDKVEEAVLLVFDYGYHNPDLAHGRFFEGSMVGYRQMKLKENLFEELGAVDITHHVNFDHLTGMFEHLGWVKAGEIEQYRFLINIGVLERIATLPQTELASAKGVINPHGIGSMISVLGFSKNIRWEVPGFNRGPL